MYVLLNEEDGATDLREKRQMVEGNVKENAIMVCKERTSCEFDISN